jgi:hypothetical protein
MLTTILLAILIKFFYALREIHLTRANIYPNKIKYLYIYEHDYVYEYVYDNIDMILKNIQAKFNSETDTNTDTDKNTKTNPNPIHIEWKEINDYFQNDKFYQSNIINYIDEFINQYGNDYNKPDIDQHFIKPDFDKHFIKSDIDQYQHLTKPDLKYKIRIGEYLMGGINFKRKNRWCLFKENIDFFSRSFEKYTTDYDLTYKLFIQRNSILKLLEDTCFLLEYDPKYRSDARKIRIQLSQLLLLELNWY